MLSIRAPIDGLWLGSTKHFYPRLNNGDSVVNLAKRMTSDIRANRKVLELAIADRRFALSG